MGRSISCAKCHTSTQPVQWNDYGGAVLAALPASFEDGLMEALAAVEDEDSDGDGLTNLEEIELGTQPGDELSQWVPRPEPFGAYDHAFAYKRVLVLYCGTSPSYGQRQKFEAADDADKNAITHEALSACLDSQFWVDEGLDTLAHRKIRPVKSYGADTEIMISGVRTTLADYAWDYRLWKHVLTGDRDARELLTARYHIDGDGDVVEDIIPNPEGLLGGGQLLDPAYRAGMLTTQWNLFLNVMFAGIPRVAAGHAYREYLGLDLSLQQGVRPVAGEPLDLDGKGVSAPGCAQCHSTLDPLAYAFAPYEGINVADVRHTGTYRPDRPAELIPGWDSASPQMVLLDTPVTGLVDMARVMADSPEFQRNLGHMFFVHAVGHEPQPDEVAEFEAVWTSMPDDGFSANRLIHRLVDTEAFGTP